MRIEIKVGGEDGGKGGRQKSLRKEVIRWVREEFEVKRKG